MLNRCEVYAHRGGAGLYPESSLIAYQHAIALGVDVLDVDIGVTKDGVIVASHFSYLTPELTRDANGAWLSSNKPLLIKDFTFEQLQQFDIGFIKPDSEYAKQHPNRQSLPDIRIASLQQIFDLAKNHPKLRFQLEVKTDPTRPDETVRVEDFMQALNQLLINNQISHRVEVHSFDWRNMLLLQQLNSDVKTSYITSKYWIEPELTTIWQAGHSVASYNNYAHLIAELGGNIWCPDFRDISTQCMVDDTHKMGLKLTSWTVNEPESMQKLVKLGLNGIITDYPDRLLFILADTR